MRLAFALLLTAACFFQSTLAKDSPGEKKISMEELKRILELRGPKAGNPAPDFTLTDIQGNAVRASQLWSRRPLVIITASYSCPTFRHSAAALADLVKLHGHEVNFAIVYTVEAHTEDGRSPYWKGSYVPMDNREEKVAVQEPQTLAERRVNAERTAELLGLNIQMFAVDDMSNTIWNQYGCAPNCAYLINTRGEVVTKQGIFEPVAFAQQLEALLHHS